MIRCVNYCGKNGDFTKLLNSYRKNIEYYRQLECEIENVQNLYERHPDIYDYQYEKIKKCHERTKLDMHTTLCEIDRVLSKTDLTQPEYMSIFYYYLFGYDQITCTEKMIYSEREFYNLKKKALQKLELQYVQNCNENSEAALTASLKKEG